MAWDETQLWKTAELLRTKTGIGGFICKQGRTNCPDSWYWEYDGEASQSS